MILLVVGLVAVLVVVVIAVVLSIRLGRGDEHDEPDMRPRGRGRRADEDERWREHDTRRAPSASARGTDSRGRRGEYPGYAERGAASDRDRAVRGRDYHGPPHRPARADATDYRKPVGARSPVQASAQARGRYDTGPQLRTADGDFPSADYPSRDLGPAGARPSGDHPSVEFSAADYDAVEYPEDRRERRRKAASASGKSRSRQRGKRDNDDDWPSTEWDKLSDEQYWAELSADKPLAAMAKPSRPASSSGAKAPVNGSAKKRAAEPQAAREPRPARAPAPAPPARDLPSRTEPREPVTERLPVRTRQRPPAPAARREADTPLAGSSYPAEPRSPRDTGPHAQRDPLRDTGPRARRDTGPQAIRDTGPHPSPDTGPRPERPRRSSATGPDPARDRDLAMLSAPPPIPGALDDDPLTSPSFSLKADTAADSRAYGSSRKHAKPSGQGVLGHANGHGNGNGNGSYPAADYPSAGYAYHTAPPAAPGEQWHSAPPAPAEARAPAYGNPYQHSGPGTVGLPAGGQAAPGHAGYLADPLRIYSPPGYQAPQYAAPAGPAYQALPDLGATAPPRPATYADGHAQYPYPDRAAYPDGYAAGGYPGRYEAGYTGDPHTGGGYGPYPSQG
jgi:hypothetical protein